jgi:hypothetical protein
MRKIVMMLSFAALQACADGDGDPDPAPPAPESAIQSESVDSQCTDAWECWCNTFSTSATCGAASTPNGWHCYWAGASVAASAPAVGQCHATYE